MTATSIIVVNGMKLWSKHTTEQGAQKSLEEIEIDLENMKSTRSVDDIK